MTSEPQSQRGYGPSRNLTFDGKEANYERWEVKLLAYLSIRKLKKTVLTTGTGAADAAKNEEVYSEIVQLLDDRSLSLIMREAKDDGRKALKILREHYASKSKPRVIALYSRLWSLSKEPGETLTDYVIRSEAAANALKDAGEDFKDLMLISVVMKGLPNMFEPFIVNMHARGDDMTFADFKVALRIFEENKKIHSSTSSSSKIMYSGGGFHNKSNGYNSNNGGKKITCFKCGKEGHKANRCQQQQQQQPQNNKNNQQRGQGGKLWCSVCKMSNHSTQNCGKRKDKVNAATDETIDHSFDFGFSCRVVEDEVVAVEDKSDDNEEDGHTFDLHVYKKRDGKPVASSDGDGKPGFPHAPAKEGKNKLFEDFGDKVYVSESKERDSKPVASSDGDGKPGFPHATVSVC